VNFIQLVFIKEALKNNMQDINTKYKRMFYLNQQYGFVADISIIYHKFSKVILIILDWTLKRSSIKTPHSQATNFH